MTSILDQLIAATARAQQHIDAIDRLDIDRNTRFLPSPEVPPSCPRPAAAPSTTRRFR